MESKIVDVRALMDEATVEKTIAAISAEVSESYQNEREKIVFVGVATRGVPAAQRATQYIQQNFGLLIPMIVLEIKIYEDDLSYVHPQGNPVSKPLANPEEIDGKILIVWDDVAYTLATNAAVYAILTKAGKPAKIEFAVLVDRVDWHQKEREIYAPRFVGLRQSTHADEIIKVRFAETDQGNTSVWLQRKIPTKGENHG